MSRRTRSAFWSRSLLPLLVTTLTWLYVIAVIGYAIGQMVQLQQETWAREAQGWEARQPIGVENLASLEVFRESFLRSRGTSLAFSRSGRWLAAGSDAGETTVFDIRTGQQRGRSIGGGRFVLSVAFAPQETVIASGDSNGLIHLWNIADGTPPRTLQGHSSEVNALAFHPSEPWLASGDSDAHLFLWNWQQGEILQTRRLNSVIGAIAFSPDGEWLAAGDQSGAIWLWKDGQSTPLCRWQHPGGVASLHFRADSHTVYVAGGQSISVWDTQACVQRRLFSAPEGEPVSKLALSPNEHLLAAAGGQWRAPRLWIWSLPEGVLLLDVTLPARSEAIRDLAFDPSGRVLLTTSHDGCIRWWGVR